MWWWLYALAVMSGAVVGEDAAQELETQRGPRRGRPRREGMGDRPRSRRREMPLSDDEMGLREMRRRNKMRRREDADEGEDGAWTPQAGPRPKKKKWRRKDGESREDGAIRERAGASRPPRGGKGGGRRSGEELEGPMCHGVGVTRDVTLVTQTSLGRTKNLKPICERWRHRISVAVRLEAKGVSDKEVAKVKRDTEALVSDCENAVVQVVARREEDDEYPVNFLRNLAWHGATTSHALMLDIDFLPATNTYFAILSLIHI